MAALPMTTKLSGKIEEVIKRRSQSETLYFFPSAVRAVTILSPGAMADVYDADGGRAPVKRRGLGNTIKSRGDRRWSEGGRGQQVGEGGGGRR